MNKPFLASTSVAAIVVCAWVGARPDEGLVRVTLRLQDSESGEALAGVIRIHADGEAEPLTPANAYSRLRGVSTNASNRGWFVVPAQGLPVDLPRRRLIVEGFSGLETQLARREWDLRKASPGELVLPLSWVFRPDERGLAAANTHLHLRNINRMEADEYLRQVPVADRLAVLFISYLERIHDDAHYITNEYPTGDVTKLVKAQGVVIHNGQEYRHNFGTHGQGYGHVMFLNLKDRLLPSSLGPGITGRGGDDEPLRGGIDAARAQGATVIWCHNAFGFEGIPCVLTGRVDAVNVFDGSRSDSFEDKYYRYLNVGLRLPISTGTDWFQYDFSRVYVPVNSPVTVAGWLAGLRSGQSVATNGPLLTLRVNGQGPGQVLELDGPAEVVVEAAGLGRQDFEHLELVHNGRVVARQQVREEKGCYRAQTRMRLRMDRPGWIAARVLTRKTNELGQAIFAHTSPVYIDLAGERLFDPSAAEQLIKLVETGREEILAKGKFLSPDGRQRVQAIHDDAIALLRDRLAKRR